MEIKKKLLDIVQAGLSQLKGYDMEYIISVLALVVSVVETALMWLDYKDCEKAKRTQKLEV